MHFSHDFILRCFEIKKKGKNKRKYAPFKICKLCPKRNLIKIKESKVKEREIRDHVAHCNQN